MILAGCSAPEGSQQERFVPSWPVSGIVSDTVTGTVQGAWSAVQTPFEDLNFKRQKIPPKLKQIADHPYVLPAKITCEDLRKEIAELDALLGPDFCTPANPTGTPPAPPLTYDPNVCTPENPTGFSRKGEYVEQGAGFARDEAVGIVSSKVNVIPFRGIVRKISGAEKHAKEVDRAYQAGRSRRAFLKGVAAALGPNCLRLPLAPTTLPAPK